MTMEQVIKGYMTFVTFLSYFGLCVLENKRTHLTYLSHLVF